MQIGVWKLDNSLIDSIFLKGEGRTWKDWYYVLGKINMANECDGKDMCDGAGSLDE